MFEIASDNVIMFASTVNHSLVNTREEGNPIALIHMLTLFVVFTSFLTFQDSFYHLFCVSTIPFILLEVYVLAKSIIPFIYSFRSMSAGKNIVLIMFHLRFVLIFLIIRGFFAGYKILNQ